MPRAGLIHALAVLLVLVAPVNSQPASGTVTDVQLLLELKASFTNGDALLSNWGASSSPCGWAGIGCNEDGQVTQM